MIKFEENQLNNTEELFKSIYNDSPIGIELFDSNGKLIDLNQSCLELFGVSNKDEVKGFDLLSDPNIPKDILVKLKQRQTIHFESSFDFDLIKKHKLYQTKKSGKIYLDILITPLFLGESMSITNYIVQIQDVTNQKKAEQKLMNLNVELENQIHEKKKELTKSEERHRLILENASDLIVILDDNFKYEYINEQVHKKLMGYSKEDLIGKSSLDFIHPDDLEEASKALRKGFNEGEGVGVIRIRNKKGVYVWLEIKGKAFINKDGNTKGIMISRDITKRKKAEEKLKESEEKFRTISDQSLVSITIAQNGIIRYVNKQMEELSGYSLEEMEFWHAGEFLKIIHPDYRELVAEQSKKKQRGQDDVIDQYQIKGIKKSGEHIWVENYSKTIVYEGNLAVLSIMIDITDKKEAEKKLKDSEERYRTLIDNILDVIFEIDLNGEITYLSPQTIDILGYKPEELNNQNIYRFIHPDDQEVVFQIQKYVINSGEVGSVEFRLRNKEGRYITVSLRGQLIEKEGEKKIVGLFRDVTERKKIEEKVQEEKEKAEMYLNLVNVLIVALDREGNISLINKKGNDILGWDEGKLVGKNWFEHCLPPEDRERTKNYFKKLMRSESDVIPFYENSVMTKNGDKKVIAWSTILFKDSKGNITGALSSGEDITESKEAEEALRESEEKFRTIAEQSLMGIIILQDNKIKYVNSAAARMLNYTIDEILNMPPGGYLNFIDPDDRTIVVEQAKKKQKGIETSITGYEHRCLKKNGDTIWIQNYSKIINYEGDFADLITVIDITDRKKAEEMIRESEKKLTDLIESVPIGISISTPDGKILSCNSYAFQILGYSSREEFLNIPVINFYQDPSDREKFLELLEKGLVKDFEVKFKRKDGSVFWVSLTSVAHNEGDKTMFVNSFQDITERKNAEIIIQQSEAELAAIYNYTPIAILLLNKERRIRKINKFALNFTDRREEEVFGIHGGEALRCLYSIKDPRGCGFSEQCQECAIRNTVLDTFNTKIPHINQEATLYLLPGGDINKVHLLISTVPLKFGGEDLVLISLIDITNLKKTEQKLIESEKKYRTVINNIPGMVYRGHPDWTVEFLTNCEVISGYTEEDFLSQKQNWVDIIHPNDRESIINEGYLLNERPMSLSQIYRIITKDSSIRWVNDRKISFFDENGVFCGVDGIVYDITDYKLAEQKLRESETRYRDLFENSPIALFEQDFSELKSYIDNIKSSGVSDFEKYFEEKSDEIINFRSKVKLIDVNRKALELYKANNKDDFISRKAQLINGLYQADTEEVLLANKKEMLSLINGYKMFETELITKTFTGDSIYLYVRTLITPGSENTWSKVIVSLLDITNRMMTEQKLKESEEKFRNIAEQTSLGLLIQQDGIIKFANSAVADMSEYSMRKINNWAIEDLLNIVYEEDLPLINAMVNLVRSDNFDTSEQFECRIVTKSGIMKWLEIIAKPMIYLGKKAVFSTLIDTTAKKKLEEELKEISRLKSELLSRTSHELKTPLVSIKGYADLLLSQHYEMLDIYTVSVLHEIKQGCNRLESLIKDLIETSKLESDEIELNKSEDDLAFLVKFCIRDLKGLLENRKHKLILEIHDKLITVFEKERIYEVITNLLSNAIKYTPRNGIISIKSEIKENTYIISIEDNGIGLSDDEKFKIFKKFGKVERYGKGMDVVSEGSGLGLYISKKIIELHGGDIWVESKGRDKGSTFHFSLPIIK